MDFRPGGYPADMRAWLLATMLMCLLSGCAAPQQAGGSAVQSNEPVSIGQTGPSASAADAPPPWPYRPASMRIHPLTRRAVDPSTGDDCIEARIEFLDRDGDTTKCFGKLAVNMRVQRGTEVDTLGVTVDFTDLRENATRFDEVTRTYLVRLRIVPQELPDVVQLVARYDGADGDELHHNRTVRIHRSDGA